MARQCVFFCEPSSVVVLVTRIRCKKFDKLKQPEIKKATTDHAICKTLDALAIQAPTIEGNFNGNHLVDDAIGLSFLYPDPANNLYFTITPHKYMHMAELHIYEHGASKVNMFKFIHLLMRFMSVLSPVRPN